MTWAPILWLVGFVPALVALYFLKLKRRDVVISSTLLWKRSLEDLRVNAPFQKLRRNWLLLLQLLVLAGLILALWRPRIAGKFEGGRNLIVLLDTSASTSAREKDGTRLDAEKREALQLIQGMGDSDRMAILSFSSKTATLEPLTADKARLESRVRGLDGTALPTNLSQALVVAHSIAETLPSAEVYVIGDGCYGDLSGAPPEVKHMNVQLLGKGTALDNVGIVEMDVRRTFESERKTEVFLLIENRGAKGAATTVSLEVNGSLKDAKKVDIAALSTQPVTFDCSSVEEGVARAYIEGGDAFPLDDQAWARIEKQKPVSVLLAGKPNPWIEIALKTAPQVTFRRMAVEELSSLIAKTSPEDVERTLAADVLIFDREAPPGPPVLPAIYFACQPPLPKEPPLEEVKKLPVIVDWDRTHPINRFLSFTDLYIEESRVFPAWRDYQSILDADSGSLIGVTRFARPGKRPIPVILAGFDILKTNWPIGHYSFPIFFSNAVAWLGSGLEGGMPARLRSGDPLVYYPARGEALPPNASAELKSPSGRMIPLLREESGALVLSSADEVGVYDLVLNGAVRASFPVSLLNSAESNLTPSSRVDFGDFRVEIKASLEERGRDLWKWFALGAFCFLVYEWHVYTKRLSL